MGSFQRACVGRRVCRPTTVSTSKNSSATASMPLPVAAPAPAPFARSYQGHAAPSRPPRDHVLRAVVVCSLCLAAAQSACDVRLRNIFTSHNAVSPQAHTTCTDRATRSSAPDHPQQRKMTPRTEHLAQTACRCETQGSPLHHVTMEGVSTSTMSCMFHWPCSASQGDGLELLLRDSILRNACA